MKGRSKGVSAYPASSGATANSVVANLDSAWEVDWGMLLQNSGKPFLQPVWAKWQPQWHHEWQHTLQQQQQQQYRLSLQWKRREDKSLLNVEGSTSTGEDSSDSDINYEPLPASPLHVNFKLVDSPYSSLERTASDHPSIGSEGHATNECKRCAFFPKGRCRNGTNCAHCHYPHDERAKRRKRRVRQEGLSSTESSPNMKENEAPLPFSPRQDQQQGGVTLFGLPTLKKNNQQDAEADDLVVAQLVEQCVAQLDLGHNTTSEAVKFETRSKAVAQEVADSSNSTGWSLPSLPGANPWAWNPRGPPGLEHPLAWDDRVNVT